MNCALILLNNKRVERLRGGLRSSGWIQRVFGERAFFTLGSLSQQIELRLGIYKRLLTHRSGNTARPISGIDPFGNGVKFDPVITKDRLSRWMQIINRASVLSAARNAPRAFCGIPRQLFEANDRAARGTGPRASRFHHQDFLLRQSRTIFFNFRNFRTLRILQLFLEKFYY